MDSVSDHIFNPKSASAALRAAVQELAGRAGRQEADYAGLRMGDLYALAVDLFGEESLPEFWVVWHGWNKASDDPAFWGDL